MALKISGGYFIKDCILNISPNLRDTPTLHTLGLFRFHNLPSGQRAVVTDGGQSGDDDGGHLRGLVPGILYSLPLHLNTLTAALLGYVQQVFVFPNINYTKVNRVHRL